MRNTSQAISGTGPIFQVNVLLFHRRAASIHSACFMCQRFQEKQSLGFDASGGRIYKGRFIESTFYVRLLGPRNKTILALDNGIYHQRNIL